MRAERAAQAALDAQNAPEEEPEDDWEPFFAGTNTPEGMRWLGGVMDSAKIAWQRARLESYARHVSNYFKLNIRVTK